MSNYMFLILDSYLITCWVLVALAHSPLTLANQWGTSVGNSSGQIKDHKLFEGNTTLQKLVGAKYGVNISGLLHFFSHKNDTGTDVSGPYYDSTPPKWQPKLLMHLVKEEIQKSNKTLKLTPETFLDNGKWYLEFSIKMESMALDDVVFCIDVNAPPGHDLSRYQEQETRADNFTFSVLWPLYPRMNGTNIYCKGEIHINGTSHEVYSETIPIVFQTVIEKVENEYGPWVWPSAPVIVYHKPTRVELDCWAWLDFDDSVTWYLIQGNNTVQLATAMQNYSWGYVKLVFSKTFDSSDTGSVIVCEATPDPDMKSSYAPPRNITLLYYEPIDVTDECKNVVMLGWGMLALLALSAVVALATSCIPGNRTYQE